MARLDQQVDDLTQTRKKMELAGTLRWFHWLIVLSSLLLTFGAWYFSKTQLDAKIEVQFEREMDQVVDLIVDRMKKYEDALWSGVGLIQTTGGDASFPEWETFATSLRIEERYPGINGIGVIHRVIPEQLDAYLERQQAIRPDYAIHPPHQETEYWPITYVVPVGPNAKAIGLDMAHETNRFTAGKKARDTGLAQITGPITLVQDAAKTPGFLFYAPFYLGGRYESLEVRQTEFVGMVYAPFIVNKLMEGVLAQHNRHIGLRMSDQGDVLYDEHTQANLDFDSHPLFQKEVVIPLYGRDWLFDIRSTQAFRTATFNNQPTIILFGGLIIDGLLLVMFILMSRGSRKAITYANEANRQIVQGSQRLQAVMDTAVDGIITIDDKGTIQDCNPAASRIFGYSPEEMVGQNVKMLMPSPYHEEHDGYLNRYQETGEQHIIGSGGRELIGKRKDGTTFPMDLSVGEMLLEDQTLFSGLVRDITERKEAEEALKATNEELERFAYIASHDLKAPLRVIDNASKWLEEDLAEHLTHDNRENMDLMRGRVKRMNKLLDDLLEYSRVGRATDDRYQEQVNGIILVEEIVELLAPPEGFTIDVSPAFASIQFLRMPLQQILLNLINNALKHHDKAHGLITIGVEEHIGHYRLTVTDDGPGIPQTFHEQVFDMFKTLKPRDQVEGSGMGLAMVKKHIDLAGGTVHLESTEGQGSTFIILWPKQHTMEGVPA